ncbi:MAG: hypothetical protein IJH20_02065 [Bacilli bacterium]|nr:hypothetical protein [Bacilli bacterium]
MKQYKFNTDELYKTINEVYPTKASMFYSELNYKDFTKENLDKIVSVIKEIINNPIIEDIPNSVDSKEVITCFSDKTNRIMNEIFNNTDLLFYGHGGNAEAIIADEFKCRYPNLQSHFVSLSSNNESLKKLKEWPHMACKQIAIMAINKHEFNPLYKKREATSTYDTNIYSIENEFFVGYYDSENDEFIKNPNFKERHDFNPDVTIYPDEMVKTNGLFVDGPDEIVNIYKELDYLRRILYFSSYFELDEIGYKKLEQQVLYRINEIYILQEKITPEFIKQQDEKSMNGITNDIKVDEWGFPLIEPNTNNKKM